MTNTIMNIKSSFFVGTPTINCDFNTGNKNEMNEAQELLSILFVLPGSGPSVIPLMPASTV